ncbi:hypothetical protein HMPREF1589_00725 [Escherichia coli 113290]|nr:hypothetical protein HMPREF1589_00725 [Escherichia coli 113290]
MLRLRDLTSDTANNCWKLLRKSLTELNIYLIQRVQKKVI